MSWGSSVSTASDYRLDDRAIHPQQRQRILPLACVQISSEVHVASCLMGTGVHFPGGNGRASHDADHSPLSSAEVENE
jgi:hypothetical protein